MIILVILIFIIIAFLQIPGLIEQKLWRELTAVSVFLVIGFALSLLQVIGVKIPSPNQGILILAEIISDILK
ncbi:hypothetical protein JT739_00340 [Tepidanaerobacter sp. GT38]|uniref:hypothetical protein n=1 Tax=Tepidanaerobacter sp. GT38 TaxID=2722793 RepID=UPI001F2CFB66|nr:hypothetical protein [Tepidanaerobacter sp. GT38]MCG1011045.1 hypothetical protein [Tepidanaerobacter sp. GT38]